VGAARSPSFEQVFLVAQQQAATTAILQVATGITRLEADVGGLRTPPVRAGFMAQKEISEQIKRETDEDLREERELFRANEFINGTTARHPRGVLCALSGTPSACGWGPRK
jgi:hypothetical protein